MAEGSSAGQVLPGYGAVKPAFDIGVTIAAWIYYTLGYLLFFAPLYVAAALFASDRQEAFQRLNHRFYRIFFRLLLKITPGLSLEVPADIRAIRSAVVVSNHISYLDPVLLISLFPKHSTIVKGALFNIPFFGRMLKMSGYIPSSAEKNPDLVIRGMENLPRFFGTGGTLFIFPEGTRSRSREIRPFNKGAFKIAKRQNVPIQILFIRNTDRLYRPDRFWFDTCVENRITVERIGELLPETGASVSEQMARVRRQMERAGGNNHQNHCSNNSYGVL